MFGSLTVANYQWDLALTLSKLSITKFSSLSVFGVPKKITSQIGRKCHFNCHLIMQCTKMIQIDSSDQDVCVCSIHYCNTQTYKLFITHCSVKTQKQQCFPRNTNYNKLHDDARFKQDNTDVATIHCSTRVVNKMRGCREDEDMRNSVWFDTQLI